MGRKGKRTESWQEPFLRVLADTCNVRLACRVAGIGRTTAYRRRDRSPAFAERWDDAVDDGVDVLEAEAFLRASSGRDKPVYYQGNVVGTVKDYSDSMLMFLLRANRPEKYRNNSLRKLIDELAGTLAAEPKPKSARKGRGRRRNPDRDVA